MDAEHHLWRQHRFVLGESVYVKGARELGPYTILSAYFVGENLRLTLTLTRGVGVLILSEDSEGKLPLKPACFIQGEQIWHPDHGIGRIYAVSPDDKKIDMVLDCGTIISVKKMRKVRRFHPFAPNSAPHPYSTDTKTPCQSSPMLSNLPSRKKS